MSTLIEIDAATYQAETPLVQRLAQDAGLDDAARLRIVERGAGLVRKVRDEAHPGLMEVFLAEYGLSTQEGVALMCLAEALLRVPDPETIDALIEDKIAPSDWSRHMGHSTSPLVNASTWALMLTGKVLDDPDPGLIGTLRGAVKRLGEPVIRGAVGRAMKEMGRQFVLGETITSALKRAAGMEAKGYTYSYDMLGEAARTEHDATRYHLAYSRAITAIAEACKGRDVRTNPGISVKLSALHPRYEVAQQDRVMQDLVPRLRSLALLAKSAGMGLNVDAEEADRLVLSLHVIEAVMSEPALAGWDGFGVVVQAYGKRAGMVIDWLHDMAQRLDRKIMVRLVKGAYWDTEIKRAQVEGLDSFPVFTSKSATDISYLACARKLLSMTDRLYPQFATHNAHTVAAVLEMAGSTDSFEFQRLHGMGEALHDFVRQTSGANCRIYAPVGAHRDLLAYLVRRLLENGANSSFVNQIVNEEISAEDVVRDPFLAIADTLPTLKSGRDLYTPERANSKGFDLSHYQMLAAVEEARGGFRSHVWTATPLLAMPHAPERERPVENPALPSDTPGVVCPASRFDIETALDAATPWEDTLAVRKSTLNRVASLYEEHFGELFALLAREAGKTLPDAVAEIREAVDFLRYYAAIADDTQAVGTFCCISPWNFPLAIFTGQIAAALATGNAVLAKPAEQTPLIAFRAVELMHQAGVPRSVLQLLPGGPEVGAALTGDSRVGGVAFTGSTGTALKIRSAMADHLPVGAPLIAETGGLNAMIVDSTALPEQAVQAVVESAFQSAGQRCSALRCLYVQSDIADAFLEMLTGAMNELSMGDPWDLATDIGPVIDEVARKRIAGHIDHARAQGQLIHETRTPNSGRFIAPTLIAVSGIPALKEEIFGPVLHVATFDASELDKVIADINATGYGLTFGLMTRIDDRVQHVSDRVRAGNIYVNRNQIGAIVGSQPFGGEGLSGTGPKAGGPNYLARFCKHPAPISDGHWSETLTGRRIQSLLDDSAPQPGKSSTKLPGPTGEDNLMTTTARLPFLCLGPGRETAEAQANAVRALGGRAEIVAGQVDETALQTIEGFSGVLWWGDAETGRRLGQALASRSGPILPLVTGLPDPGHVLNERLVCIDTTAAGGNAELLGGAS